MNVLERLKHSVETKTFMPFEFEGVMISNPFYDETLRFEVNPLEYYGTERLVSNMVEGFYQYSLSQIESHLDVKPVRKDILPADCRNVTMDNWYEVEKELKNLRQISRDPSFSVSIFGYELVEDNHYIRLYYTHRPLFS